jgi:hypothetical protein
LIGARWSCAEFDEDAITGGFDNPTVMLSNLEINEFVPASLKRFVSAFLGNAHESRL